MIGRAQATLSPIAEDVLRGLTRMPKSLPPKLFYDAEGSELFEQITQLPEYYLTRTETGILEANAEEIAARAGADVTLVELGAGTAAKTRIILRALLQNQPQLAFYPVDVCSDPLRAAAASLKRELPRVQVKGIVADYTHNLRWLKEIDGRKLVMYIGSSIGNFEPFQATALLAKLRRALSPGDALLLGTDMVKDPLTLIAAYDDAQGVTTLFNKNVLARINRELGGHFELASFRHVAVWNRRRSRMEMYLESMRPQDVAIDGLGITVRFAACERLHTENSYKFTMAMIQSMIENSGMQLETTWTDAQNLFTVHLARV